MKTFVPRCTCWANLGAIFYLCFVEGARDWSYRSFRWKYRCQESVRNVRHVRLHFVRAPSAFGSVSHAPHADPLCIVALVIFIGTASCFNCHQPGRYWAKNVSKMVGLCWAASMKIDDRFCWQIGVMRKDVLLSIEFQRDVLTADDVLS